MLFGFRYFLVACAGPLAHSLAHSLDCVAIHRQTHSVGEEHEEHEKAMAAVQTALDTLMGSSDEGKDDANRATVLSGLKGQLTQFGKDVLEHLDHEEHSFATPIARKVYIYIYTAQMVE